MQYLPVVISLLSLGVALTTLFVSHFRGPRISVHVGPTIKLYYPANGGFAVYIPTTFINDSARMGAVLRAAISLARKEKPQERFFFEWGSISIYDPQSGNWRFENVAHALAIPGRTAVNKLLWFNWLASSVPPHRISNGEYLLTIHYWTTQTGTPANAVHRLHVSAEVFAELESHRTNGRAYTVDVVLDRQLDRNRLMTPDETRALLNV